MSKLGAGRERMERWREEEGELVERKRPHVSLPFTIP